MLEKVVGLWEILDADAKDSFGSLQHWPVVPLEGDRLVGLAWASGGELRLRQS